MIVFDTDIITLLTYGQTPTLRDRIALVPEGEILAVTVITLMEVMGPRYDGPVRALVWRTDQTLWTVDEPTRLLSWEAPTPVQGDPQQVRRWVERITNH